MDKVEVICLALFQVSKYEAKRPYPADRTSFAIKRPGSSNHPFVARGLGRTRDLSQRTERIHRAPLANSGARRAGDRGGKLLRRVARREPAGDRVVDYASTIRRSVQNGRL